MLPAQHKNKYVLYVANGHRGYITGSVFESLLYASRAAKDWQKIKSRTQSKRAVKCTVSVLRIVEVIQDE